MIIFVVLKTECCNVTIVENQRYCPKCGWEARVYLAPLKE